MAKGPGKIAGMILAAGYGKRMRPLTSYIPKPLIPVLGIPMIELVAAKLTSEGASRLYANSHHLTEKIEEHVLERGLPIKLHREETLLGTGGGIGNMAASLLDEEIVLLANSDILTDIQFGPAVAQHIRTKALATMILVSGDPSLPASFFPPPHVIAGPDGSILGFIKAGGNRQEAGRYYGYTGMSVLSRDALGYFPSTEKKGLLDILRIMISERPGSVAGYIVPQSPAFSWSEIGAPRSFIELHERLLSGRETFSPLLETPPLPLHAGTNASIPQDLKWQGFLEIGANVAIGRGCSLKNCVILKDSVIGDGRSMENIIVFPEGEMKAE